MLKHNLLLALRNFNKQRNSFLINLIGLCAGLTCFILIYLWVNDELQMNKFHEKDSRLYQVMENQQYADEIMTTRSTPGLLAAALKEEVPEVEYAATTTWINDYTLSIGDKNIPAEGYHVGQDFFNMFSFNLIKGNPNNVLTDKNTIAISQSLAQKLFDDANDVVGKEVEFQHERSFTISGVFEDMPKTSSIRVDFVMSFDFYRESNAWVDQWGNNGPRTFAVLHEGADGAEVSDKIADFILGKNEDSNVELFLTKYSDLYLYGRYENGQQSGGRIEYVQLFSIVAVFILLIACINFMNLSTARASKRAKEVGIKKSVGAPQSSLISQFLTESILTTLGAALISMIIVWLFLPQFNEITDKEISFELTSTFLLLLAGITVVTGLFAGSYPAFYLSAFNPVKVLKGHTKGSTGEVMARKGLVIFQFTLSVVLIVAVVVVYQQIDYVQSKHLGYEKENLIRFTLTGKAEENLETFTRELKQIPGVVNASAVGHAFVGRNSNTSGLDWDGKNPDDLILFENISVDYDLIPTAGIELLEGRNFSRAHSTDTSKIIFNEAAIKVMGLEDPIGKVITLWDEYEMEIVGVMKNFHFQSLHDNVNPAFFRLRPENAWNMMVRISPVNSPQTLESMQQFYADFNPGFTLDYVFIDEQYDNLYASEQRVSTLSQYFAGFAVIISCLGLFGLATFTAQRRLKEIGVRKALGASSSRIVFILTKEFSVLVFISILIALPLSYMAAHQWLSSFAFKINLSPLFFIGAGLTALVIAWLTVSTQAIKAANSNPAECLKDE